MIQLGFDKLKVPILYGIAIALGGTLLMLGLLAIDMLGPKAIASQRQMIGGSILFLSLYLFLLIGIYLVLKRAKQENKGLLTFREGLTLGLIVSLTTALFSVVLTYLFYEFLYPHHVDELLLAIEDQMNILGLPEDKIDFKLAEKEIYYSTGTQAGYSFIGNLITGLSFTLLLSFFLKNKE